MRARALPDQHDIVSIAAVLFTFLEAPPYRQIHVRSHTMHIALGTIPVVGREDEHAVRGQRYRYIRHPNGTEQLYDHQTDPNEFTNLADRPELAAVKIRLTQWLPKTNAAPVRNKK